MNMQSDSKQVVLQLNQLSQSAQKLCLSAQLSEELHHLFRESALLNMQVALRARQSRGHVGSSYSENDYKIAGCSTATADKLTAPFQGW